MSRNPSAIRPWLLMLLMLGAATALRVALEPVLGERFPLLTYYPMTVFLALLAGPWPAAAGLAASAVLSEALFASGRVTQADLVALAIYVPINVLLIVLVERVRRTGEGARHRERAARENETSSVAHRGLLATALESVDAGVHSWDPASGEAQWDTRLRSLLGFDVGEPATHAAFLDRVHPDDRRRFEDAVADAGELVGPRR
jgi:PAS domain-containing protein